tara:strand:+ start:63 stop:293 length:231 start_codon:yes stop_codon:yes gene_type:complete
MENKIKKIIAKTFKCEISELNENSAIYKIKKWDSLTHFELVDNLEDEFNIKFKPGEAETLTSLKIIYSTIKSHNAK